ncbi:hypothetical protein [Mycolicibacterium sediminis]|uniref:Uncharacterized protein n=1 Tax=Mycolicibacterium sediminis TaxID=1286180 RepID=A0A7I7QQ54_9MYCO|nr:hypothetical protein [Mycolicibacterium sediminis]BBY28424.1 hypothetical protein MSEDJ_25200 [Mycolicibacterium sediminis]
MTRLASLRDHPSDRAEQVEQLRRKMAAMSGRVASRGGSVQPTPGVQDGLLPTSENLLPMPESLADLLPGALPRGAVAVVSGARSLMLGVVASVTSEGGHVAIVGMPDVGLLAAVEMGADLSRLAVVPDPGADPVEVAAVLMDGLDLVVLNLGGRSVAPTRARAVTARARQKQCTLLVAGGDWPGASARLEAKVSGYEVTGAGSGPPVPGCGRIAHVRLALRGRARSSDPVRAVGG